MLQQKIYRNDCEKLFEEGINSSSQDKLRGFQLGNFQTEENISRLSVNLQTENNLHLVGFIMMSKENENNSFVLLVDSKLEDLILHNMNSSFSSEFISKGFVMIRVKNDFIDFVVNNLSEKIVFSGSFVNLSFTENSKSEFITYFESNSLKNSSAELYILPVSFKDLFNNSICSGLEGSSSTGCQSICSQNSQSSSVTSPVCLYLCNMSFFINLITALANNSEFNLTELFDLSNTSSIEKPNKRCYKKLSVISNPLANKNYLNTLILNLLNR